jgi:hypothetical protein
MLGDISPINPTAPSIVIVSVIIFQYRRYDAYHEVSAFTPIRGYNNLSSYQRKGLKTRVQRFRDDAETLYGARIKHVFVELNGFYQRLIRNIKNSKTYTPIHAYITNVHVSPGKHYMCTSLKQIS